MASHLMSAGDNTYLVPVGLRGENKKRRGERRRKMEEEDGGFVFANLWPKSRGSRT